MQNRPSISSCSMPRKSGLIWMPLVSKKSIFSALRLAFLMVVIALTKLAFPGIVFVPSFITTSNLMSYTYFLMLEGSLSPSMASKSLSGMVGGMAR